MPPNNIYSVMRTRKNLITTLELFGHDYIQRPFSINIPSIFFERVAS